MVLLNKLWWWRWWTICSQQFGVHESWEEKGRYKRAMRIEVINIKLSWDRDRRQRNQSCHVTRSVNAEMVTIPISSSGPPTSHLSLSWWILNSSDFRSNLIKSIFISRKLRWEEKGRYKSGTARLVQCTTWIQWRPPRTRHVQFQTCGLGLFRLRCVCRKWIRSLALRLERHPTIKTD